MSELGFADVNADAWFALFAPAGTPPAIVARLNAEFVKALNDPAVTKPLLDQSLDILPGSPDELSQVVSRDLARYGILIKDIGVKVE